MTKQPPFVIHVSEMDDFPGAVYIGRENGRKRLNRSKWHNPFKFGPKYTLEEVIGWFSLYITVGNGSHLRNDLSELTGKPIACWCRRSDAERTEANMCHGDVLVTLWKESNP